MRHILAALTLVWLVSIIGCSSSKEGTLTTIVHDTCYVPVYYADTLGTAADGDSVVTAQDSIIVIKYYPKEKKMWYAVHDTIRVTHTDTVKTPTEVKQELTLLQKLAITWFLPSVAVNVAFFVVICLLVLAMKFL